MLLPQIDKVLKFKRVLLLIKYVLIEYLNASHSKSLALDEA